MRVKDVILYLEEKYPAKYAYDWDNVGLQIGDERQKVNNILTALEINKDVLLEAQKLKIDLIIVHHPIIFGNLNSLTYEKNSLILKLIKSNISVYCLHTNLDIYFDGMNDWIAKDLSMFRTRTLSKLYEENLLKVEIEIPKNNEDEIFDFFKREEYNLKNFSKYTQSSEVKTVISEKKTQKYQVTKISIILSEQKYTKLQKYLMEYRRKTEIDLYIQKYKLDNMKINIGLGRIGRIDLTTTEELAEKIKKLYNLKDIKMVGNREKKIVRMAIVAGSGGKLLDEAIKKKADVFISGDIGYHDAIKAQDNNVAIIDVGHSIESIFGDKMSRILKRKFIDTNVYKTKYNFNPFETV